MNKVWRRTPRGMRLTDEGKAFKNRCTNIVRELVLKSRSMRALPPQLGWRLMVVFWLPRLETAQWLRTGKGERFAERDIDNLWKLTLDGIFGALGENDSQVIGITTDKKFGHGEGRLDFMLKDEAVPAEEPNATELSDEINSRGGAIRASPTDHPALLYHHKAHVPDGGEYRFTHFDAWRLALMDIVLGKFQELQGRLTCPARSGRLDACFECTDFMVVYCLMNNPVALNSRKERAGLFDLCQQRVGSHVSLVDRPQGGERMESQTAPKTPSAHFLEVLILLGKVEQNTRLLSTALTAIFEMLNEPLVKKEEPMAQEACIKLAVVMLGMVEAGAGKPLPRSVIYYRDVTDKNMPDEVADRISKAGGAYKLCVQLYGEYRRLFIEWSGGQPAQPQQPAAATPPTPATAAPAPAQQVIPGTQDPQPTPAEPAAPAPEKRTRRTRKEMASAEPPPEVTADASVEVQPSGDMPRTNEIPPDGTPAEEVQAESDDQAAENEMQAEAEAQQEDATPSEETPAEEPVFVPPPTHPGSTHADINARLDRLEKLVAKLATKNDLAAQLKRLEAIAPAFNSLREWLVKQAKQG